MTQLQITDPELLAHLQSKGFLEVTDAAGRVLGKVAFKPMSCPEIGLTDEEIQRRLNDPNAKWYTADEVMARLRSRLNGGR